MPGTLLVYDAAFPRGGRVIATPSLADLTPPAYPRPCEALPIPETSDGPEVTSAILRAARRMRRVDCLILFGHGRVIEGIFTGIQIGANGLIDMAVLGPSLFRRLHFSRRGRIELWVCEAASTASASGMMASGQSFCRGMAMWAGVPVIAGREVQHFDTLATEFPSDSDGAARIRTVIRFLPWEGPVDTFAP